MHLVDVGGAEGAAAEADDLEIAEASLDVPFETGTDLGPEGRKDDPCVAFFDGGVIDEVQVGADVFGEGAGAVVGVCVVVFVVAGEPVNTIEGVRGRVQEFVMGREFGEGHDVAGQDEDLCAGGNGLAGQELAVFREFEMEV